MALSNGPNLGLLVNGSLGEEHYDEVLAQWRGLDALVQPTVITRNTTIPPATPADGDMYIVPTAASGAWADHVGKLARWSSVVAAWEFYTPKEGWQAFVQDEDIPVYSNGLGDWAALAGGIGSTPSGQFTYKGTIDCSVNPNYPAANAGDIYSVSVRGRIGGPAGPQVRFGDSFYCRTNGRPAGTHAELGLHWVLVEGIRRGVQVLTDEATIGVNCSFGTNFRVVLGGNRTLAYPTNMIDGDFLFFRVKQDATGGRTLAFASGYVFADGEVPVLSTAPNAIDIFSGQYDAADNNVVLTFNTAFA